MTCRDVESWIIPYASGAAIAPEAAAHIAGCERCRRLVEALGKTRHFATPSQQQLKRIETGILADLKPVKPLAPAGQRFWTMMLVLMIVVAVGAAMLGSAGWRALSLLQKVAVFAALASGVCLLGISAGRQIVPGQRLPITPYALVAAVFGGLVSIVAAFFHPLPESLFVATGLVCLRIGLEYAAPAAVLFWLMLRRGVILKPAWMGATVGLLAGLTGITVLEIFCPNMNEFHILAWHLGAVLVSAAAGIAIGGMAEYAGWIRNRRARW
jgi:hypothetical protein